MIVSRLDTTLDRTVVAGYTTVGCRIRSRAWDANDLRSMDGKTVLVTGATAGLGLAAAEGFAWADTPGVASSLPRFHRTSDPFCGALEEGADTIVWLGAAGEPGDSSGGFWHDRRRRPTHRVPWTRETPADRERLWRECERLTGWHAVPLPAPTHAHA